MKLFKEVPIESAEQAEALPVGTLARHSEGAGMDHAHKLPAGPLTRSHWVSSMGVESNAAMVGWTALVPVEVKEEWRASWPADDAHQRCRDERTARLWADQQDAVAMHRLVTPWEEA